MNLIAKRLIFNFPKKCYGLFLRALNFFVFIRFENEVHKSTWDRHQEILDEANRSVQESINWNEDSKIVVLGRELRTKALNEFQNKYVNIDELRILIHLPSKNISPGGYSVFMNIANSLKYLGISTALLHWDENIENHLRDFQPTVFLSSNNKSYLELIDWNKIKQYRLKEDLKIGLTASVDDFQNNDPQVRLDWLRDNAIDFFYGFRSSEYFLERPDYQVLLKAGYEIFSLEFGANPLLYFPVSRIPKDLDYVFLASSNMDKRKRYYEWLPKIVKKHPGFIDGPGWHKNKASTPQDAHKFIYARAKIGINLHIDDSLNWKSELNERTYILAACGVPQLVDNAKLLPFRFSDEAFFIANTAEEYANKFEYMLNNPAEAERRAVIALKEVYSKHTTFHRADALVQYLLALKINNSN